MRVSRFVVPVVAVLTAVTLSSPTAVAQTSSSTVATQAAAPVARLGFQTNAFGTQVSAVDKLVTSGPTSYVSLSCTTATGQARASALPVVNLPVVGTVGSLYTRVTTATTSTTALSRTAGVNLLGGAVVADAVQAYSTAGSKAGVGSGTGATTFVGLKILGQSFAANVAPNTQVALDVGGKRVGTVTLNYQSKGTVNGVYRSYTRGIVISLLAGNPFGLPGATTITVAAAHAGITTSPRIATNGGSGWGIYARALNGAALIGRQPNVPVACHGGSGSGSIVNVSRLPLISTGTTYVTTTALSNTTRVVSSVAAPRILSGLISADAMVADVQVVLQPNGTTTAADRSKFVGLKVAGLPLITASVAPNTTVNVPGLGAVTFRKTTRTATGLEVVMLEIKLSQSIAGLPTGTIVQVAGANATIRGN
ncbi:choice-of-anchor P family protein [Knoellia sp. S7-12]|uniref:choice-of-anchor P family protein n=1 Tax=Knoellia sp. S7-12 TaxID=3126698 RepID=UPI0033665676